MLKRKRTGENIALKMHSHCGIRLCLPGGVPWPSVPFPHVYPHVYPSTNVVCFLATPGLLLGHPCLPWAEDGAGLLAVIRTLLWQ